MKSLWREKIQRGIPAVARGCGTGQETAILDKDPNQWFTKAK
jgi:hypothetical protein